MSFSRIAALTALAALGVFACTEPTSVADRAFNATHPLMQTGSSGVEEETRLEAELEATDEEVLDVEGRAEFRSRADGSELRESEFRVDVVGAPPDATLDVLINDGRVASIVTDPNGSGRVELKSQDGDFVPTIKEGDVIAVAAGGMVIAKGVFESLVEVEEPEEEEPAEGVF